MARAQLMAAPRWLGLNCAAVLGIAVATGGCTEPPRIPGNGDSGVAADAPTPTDASAYPDTGVETDAGSPTVVVGDVRVQVLSPTLVRLERKGPQGFEDRPTFHIRERSWPGSPIRSTASDTAVLLATDTFTVKVPLDATSLDGVEVTGPLGQLLWSAPDHSDGYVLLKSQWEDHGTQYLYQSGDRVAVGTSPSGDSYYWKLEKTVGYVQLKNKATGEYMHLEHALDYVECSPVEAQWESKDWIVEDVGGYKRFRNRWADHPDYIHVEHVQGYAEHAPAGTSNGADTIEQWVSARWDLGGGEFYSNNRTWLPGPHDGTRAWAIVDTPRYVPADWGYSVAPADAQFFDTNGWDLTNHAADVYLFVPNGDDQRLRSEFLALTGRTELIPLQALGGWDSRYHPYTQQEALTKIDTYRSKNIPLDVFVVDTDWRQNASFGYAVNTALFPDMQGFLQEAHDRNVNIIFNDHPEPQAGGLEPAEVAYRNSGLTSLFELGLDWWWFDRNWTVTLTPPAGINKEVFGMYAYEWITRAYYPDRRPLIMANVDGIDSGVITMPPDLAAHRYTFQWTGDTYSDFANLEREVGNALHNGIYAAYPYTSTDVGGHNGSLTTEAYCRWVEFGAFSPIFRLHCNGLENRDPWAYDAPAEEVVRKFVQLRMRLLPVFYAAARDNYDTGTPILRRCDWDYPDYPEASSPTQYLLGSGILVAPIVSSGTTRDVWIPPGTWIDAWDGSRQQGPATVLATAPVDRIPLYVRAGAVVPLAPDLQYTKQRPWDTITLDVYPHAAADATEVVLYEDDTVSSSYQDGAFRKTTITSTTNPATGTARVVIGPATGTYTNALSRRTWVVRIRRLPGWSGDPILTINGAPATYAVVPRDSTAMPFTNTGGAADGDVWEIRLNDQPVDESWNLILSFPASRASIPPTPESSHLADVDRL